MTDAVVHLPVELELMSRFLNRNFELLEPYDAKVSRTVLRGEGGSNAPDLLDTEHAVALPLFPCQPSKQGMDRRIPERSAQQGAYLGALPLQRHGMER